MSRGNMNDRLSMVFGDIPNVWGLSGEPQLWEDLKQHFSLVKIPETEQAFFEELCNAFEKLTGWPIETNTFIFINRYHKGGMTGGLIDPWNWRTVVIPTLTRRFLELRRAI